MRQKIRGVQEAKGRRLVGGGTRYRQGELTDEQSRLLTSMKPKALKRDTEQRLEGGLAPKDPAWEPFEESGGMDKCPERYDKNVSTPSAPLQVVPNEEGREPDPQDAEEDSWNPLVREEAS